MFQFATENAIPGVTFSMLQALPGTTLWDRLKASGRLLDDANLNQTTLLNFVPTRPIEEIAEEYVDAFWKLYDPKVYLKRVFDHFMLVGQAKVHQDPELRKKLANQHKTDFDLKGVLFGLKMLAKLGFVRSTRFVFWKYLYLMFKKNLVELVTSCHSLHLWSISSHIVKWSRKRFKKRYRPESMVRLRC